MFLSPSLTKEFLVDLIGRLVLLQPIARGTYRRLVSSPAPCTYFAPKIGGLRGVEFRSPIEDPDSKDRELPLEPRLARREDTPESIGLRDRKGRLTMGTVMT